MQERKLRYLVGEDPTEPAARPASAGSPGAAQPVASTMAAGSSPSLSAPADDYPPTRRARPRPDAHAPAAETDKALIFLWKGFVFLRRAVIIALAALAIWLATMFFVILAFRFFNPPVTALMLIRAAEANGMEQRWVPLDRISPNLVRAVISSEDTRFCQHYGIDPDEIRAAIRRARKGTPRGASTMTMQLAKNLFLWPDKSYVRKALEAPLTLMIEALWPKWRIAEVYLNVVEWGPGIYGAERAARHHFKRSARRLTPAQASLLAVSLPNPQVRKAGRPSRLMRRLAQTVQARMRVLGSGANCVLRPF